MPDITSVEYTDPSGSFIKVVTADGAVINTTWPNNTWYAEDIQAWIDAGNTITAYQAPALSTIQAREKARIDRAATNARHRYISPDKDATYILKSQQVDAYIAAGHPQDLTGYGYIDAEITRLGLDVTILADRQTAANTIVSTRDTWLLIDADIEKQALLGKANVDNALDEASAISAADTAISALDLI